MHARLRTGLLLLSLPSAPLWAGLSQNDKAVLQDSGGWEYLSISDANNGFETAHVCFDEQKGQGNCRGTLVLHPDMSFTQEISAEGKTSRRHGSYEWTDDGMTFADEFGTKDGPYVITLDGVNNIATLETTQAGVTVKTRLQLEKEFRKRRQDAARQKH